MSNMPRATSGEAWLEFVTRALRDHDTHDPFAGMEGPDFDVLRAQRGDKRALLAEDVANAAARLGFAVDERGYPTNTPLATEGEGEPRNGFLSMEDAQRLAGMAFGRSEGGAPSLDGALAALVPMLSEALGMLAQKTRADLAQMRGIDEQGRPRFRHAQYIEHAVHGWILGVDYEGHLWRGELVQGSVGWTWARLECHSTRLGDS